MKTIALTPVSEREATGFSLDQLAGQRYYRVIGIATRTNRHVVLEYDEGELLNPSADPLIIGTITRKTFNPDGSVTPDYLARVLWDGKLWRSLDDDTEELFHMLSGIKPAAMKEFAEKVRAGDYPRLQSPVGRGPNQSPLPG